MDGVGDEEAAAENQGTSLEQARMWRLLEESGMEGAERCAESRLGRDPPVD